MQLYRANLLLAIVNPVAETTPGSLEAIVNAVENGSLWLSFPRRGSLVENTLLSVEMAAGEMQESCIQKQVRSHSFSRLRRALLKHNDSLYNDLNDSRTLTNITSQLAAGLPGVAIVTNDEWLVRDRFSDYCNVMFYFL